MKCGAKILKKSWTSWRGGGLETSELTERDNRSSSLDDLRWTCTGSQSVLASVPATLRARESFTGRAQVNTIPTSRGEVVSLSTSWHDAG